MAADGQFREDLYFRLNVFPIHLPALRERGKDVEQLAEILATRFARRMGKRFQPLDEGQLRRLHAYDWPGNVRELQNVIERAIILSSGPRLELERAMGGLASVSPGTPPDPESAEARVLTAAEMLDFERANLIRALAECRWKVSGKDGAARILGIPPSTFTSRMKALGITRPRAH